ncbi:TPA: restriction endonuclease subunit S, partial [Escherichia coli]|nr:restriction endonuclease subunit S [Escherichia coli]
MSSVNFLEKLLDGVEVEWKTLGQTCKIETGKLNANAAVDDGKYMFFTTAKETSKIDKFRWDTEALLIAGNANVGEVKHYIGKFEAYQRTYVLTNFDENVSVRFLYFVLSHSLKKYLEERTNSAAMTYIVLSTLENFPIPIPCPGNPQKSLAIQSEIVRILDKFTALTAELTAELNMRKKQYNYYRDQLLTFKEGEVEWKALGEIGEVRMCKRILKSQTSSEGEIPFYKIGTFGKEPDSYISRKLFNEFKEKYSYPKVGEVLISASGTIGRTVIFDGRESYFQDSNIVWI